MIDGALDQFGRIDVLVDNAGVGAASPDLPVASKHGLLGLTEALAAVGAARGARRRRQPAYVRTELDATDRQAGGASFVTGTAVDVDGGWLSYVGW